MNKTIIMNITNNQKGFTLIEMLVVIAVIGILAATVLTSLGPARNKAKDTRIISALNQVRTLAETVYDGDYGGLTTTVLSDLTTEISDNNGTLVLSPVAPTDATQDYAAWSVLNDGNYFCVDSRGSTYRGATDPGIAAIPTCP